METHVYKELPVSAFDDLGSDLLEISDSPYYKTCFDKVHSEKIIQLVDKGLLGRREIKRLLPKLEGDKFEILPDDTFTIDDFPSITNDRTGQRLKFYETKTKSKLWRQSEIFSFFTTHKEKMTPEEIVIYDQQQAAFSKILSTGVIDALAARIRSQFASAEYAHD
ncbi:hypothetical protein [Pseudomonas juntendi]|uniref:hypothetical protein n=1 Tax=Pseudomonas juntendi TaxID=2666183 RepID=UPI002949A349|nr:hypothetical protein [Pseudomonas juntendi]MDV5387580.1 hypothetical protein [Pseudomonas juntendi]